jgi:hypothetical protein
MALAVLTTDESLIVRTSLAAVEQLAPCELASFRATSQAYLADPGRFERRGDSGGGPLGLGVEQVCDPLTPYILMVVTGVVTELIAPPTRRGLGGVRGWWRRLFGGSRKDRSQPSIPAEPMDAARIRELVQLVAERRGPRREQKLIVDLVARELSTAFGCKA